jgi:hypothetical protein
MFNVTYSIETDFATTGQSFSHYTDGPFGSREAAERHATALRANGEVRGIRIEEDDDDE